MRRETAVPAATAAAVVAAPEAPAARAATPVRPRTTSSIPSLPPGVVGGFDGAPPGTSGVTLVYPNAGALVPHDLAPIDVQWNGATPVYRVTFAVDNGNRLRGYVKSADWMPPAAEWQWLLDVAAGHQIAALRRRRHRRRQRHAARSAVELGRAAARRLAR